MMKTPLHQTDFSKRYDRMLCHSVSVDSFISEKNTLLNYDYPDLLASDNAYINTENSSITTKASEISKHDIVDNPPSTSNAFQEHEVTNEDNDLLESMKSELNRLESFSEKWPLDFISSTTLSKCGFFYLQSDDKVQCAFCRVIIKNWKVGDNPVTEHIKFSPRCSFLIRNSSSSIQLKKNHSAPSLQNGLLPSSTKFTHMLKLRNRQNSFRNWPVPYLSPDVLADCGLFYSGSRDTVICFSCGINLSNWEMNDNPQAEHEKFSPSCPYIQLKKAHRNGYKDGSLQTTVPQTADALPTPPRVNQVTKENPVFQEACKVFPESIVLAVMNEMQRKGRKLTSLHYLIEEILDYKQREKLKNGKCKDEVPIQLYAKWNQKPVKYEDKPKNGSKETGALKTKDNSRICIICMDEDRGVLFLPCKHYVSCENCSRQISECPVCRQPIMDRDTIYF